MQTNRRNVGHLRKDFELPGERGRKSVSTNQSALLVGGKRDPKDLERGNKGSWPSEVQKSKTASGEEGTVGLRSNARIGRGSKRDEQTTP